MLFGTIDILARLASSLLKSWYIMIELFDSTRPAVASSEPSEAVKHAKCSLFKI